MPKAKVNDINIYYEIHGDGFPLIVINGLAENIYWWSPEFVSEVSKHLKLILFDNRGAGLTDKPDIEYTIEMMADDIIGLMDVLNIEKAHILGHSMGGIIAREIATSYPKRVEKLILCSTSAAGKKAISASPEILELLSERGKPEYIIKKVTIPVNFSEEFVKNNPEKMKKITENLLRAPIPGRAFRHQYMASSKYRKQDSTKTITKPTLILHGKRDILVPPKNSKILSSQIPGAKLILFETSAHVLFYAEHEKEIKTLLEFLL